MTSARHDHSALAEALRRRVLEGPGETDAALRRSVVEKAAGGPPAEASSAMTPYDRLARQIGEAADRVTDAQVASVVAAAGSQKAAFELIAAAATGAGLLRWQRGMEVLEEAGDAPL